MRSFFVVKQFAILAVIALVITLSACGGSSTANPNSVTGNWNVTLFNSSNVATYVFTTTLKQQDANPSISTPITGSNFTPNPSQPGGCFTADSSTKVTGVLTLNDNFNGLTLTTVQLTLQNTTGTITMRGSFTTSGISGPWTFQPPTPGCSEDGTFLMTRA